MPFQDLSVELREQVFRELLCPPGGLQLQPMNSDRLERKKSNSMVTDPYDDGPYWETIGHHYEGDQEDENCNIDVRDLRDAVAAPSLPTSILYVNRQIPQEAARVLYRYNQFMFNVSEYYVLKFFRDSYPHARELVRDIGLSQWSVDVGNGGPTGYWGPLRTFICSRMNINTITITMPQESMHNHDKSKEQGLRTWRRGLASDWAWSSVESLCTLLLVGKLQQLRLVYTSTCSDPEDRRNVKNVEANIQRIRYLDRKPLGHPRREYEMRKEDSLVGNTETVVVLTIPSTGLTVDEN